MELISHSEETILKIFNLLKMDFPRSIKMEITKQYNCYNGKIDKYLSSGVASICFYDGNRDFSIKYMQLIMVLLNKMII